MSSVKQWAIDEISMIDRETGLGRTVGYVHAESQKEAMDLAGQRGLFGTGFYGARPVDPEAEPDGAGGAE